MTTVSARALGGRRGQRYVADSLTVNPLHSPVVKVVNVANGGLSMKRALSLVAVLLFLVAAGEVPKPPVAKKVPKSVTLHGDTRVDNYGWIREKSNPEVIDYLKAENAYAEAMTAGNAALSKTLYDEMLSHIKQTDANVPYREHGWYYYTRTEEGKQYAFYARKKGSTDAPEEIVLDMNK